MVGGLKPRTLKDHFGGGDDLFQRLLAALRAGLQWIIGEGLLAFELHSAILASISVDRHTFSPCSLLNIPWIQLRHYSPLVGVWQAFRSGML